MSIRKQTVLERLRVKNYRSLADIDLTFDRLVVLLGANGSGKSSIIDALRFVRDALVRNLDAAIVDRGGITSIRRWSLKGAPDVTIQLWVRGEKWSGEYSFTIASEQRGAWRVKAENLYIKQQEDIDDSILEIIDVKDELGARLKSPKTLSYQIRNGVVEMVNLGPIHGDRFKGVPFFDSTLFLNEYLIQVASIAIRELHKFIAEMSFYTIYPDSLRDPQKPGNDYPLDERGKNLASVLRNLQGKQYQDERDSLNDALGRVVGGVSSYSVEQAGGFLVTYLQHHSSQQGRRGPIFDLSQESDGTLRMLGILAALYQAPPRSLLTVEEPELTIHPGALGVLCDVLQEASARSQVVITTHSPDLIDRFSAESLRVVEKQSDTTRVGPVSHEQLHIIAQSLFSPGELMRIEGLQRAMLERGGG